MLPKVKSWRDAGDMPCRKNHQKEAKFQHLHTPSPHIASPLHIKRKKQEGSHTARCQRLTCLREADHQKRTEIGLDTEGLTETVLHLNLGFFLFCFHLVFLFVFFPFEETTTELLLRYQHRDWRLKD
jgi:hypothetical protein